MTLRGLTCALSLTPRPFEYINLELILKLIYFFLAFLSFIAQDGFPQVNLCTVRLTVQSSFSNIMHDMLDLHTNTFIQQFPDFIFDQF